MSLPRGLSTWLAVLVRVLVLCDTVEATGGMVERQNPSFITHLPTTAPDPLIVSATTASTTVTHTSVVTLSQEPLHTSTSAAVVNPSAFLLTPSHVPLATPAAPSKPPTNVSSDAATQQALASTVGDAWFGRVPTVLPDAPITGVFLVIFLLFAIAHALYFRASGRRARRAPKAYLSRLVAVFCAVRVATCIFRLFWIVSSGSALVVFCAVVTENLGTVLLVVLNFHLTKRMISFCQLKYSLYARSVISQVSNITVGFISTATFTLNTVAVALFEIQVTHGRDPTTEEHLVQVSAALVVLFGLLFNLAVFTTMVTCTWSPNVDRPAAKVVTYLLGAGLLTLTSQLVRLLAAFLIWKPINDLAATLLSKPAYYLAGFGAEVLILVLDAIWETDLFALSRESFLPRYNHPDSTTKRGRSATTQSFEGSNSRPQSSTSTVSLVKRMSSISKAKQKDNHPSTSGHEKAPKEGKASSTIISSAPSDGVRDKNTDVEKSTGSTERPLMILVQKEFRVSTSR